MSGESEAKLRGIFQEAAAVAPCIVFIGAWLGLSCGGASRCHARQLLAAAVLRRSGVGLLDVGVYGSSGRGM